MEKTERDILTQVLELMLNEDTTSTEELQKLEDQLKSMQSTAHFPASTLSANAGSENAPDPFQQTPSSTSVDPFQHANSEPSSSDPFQQPSDSVQSDDPFAPSNETLSSSNDPFQQTAPPNSQSDPFAIPANNSAGHDSDPFSDVELGNVGNDPFSSSNHTESDDPFSGATSKNANDPFQKTATPSADPFASMTNESAAQSTSSSADPFASASNAGSASFGGNDPFGGGEMPLTTTTVTVAKETGSEPLVQELETEIELLKQELKDAKTKLVETERDAKVFKEQAESFQQIGEMTVKHMLKELEEANSFKDKLKSFENALSKGKNHLFHTLRNLKQWFPYSFFFQTERKESSAKLYVGERLSLKYVVLYRLPFESELLPLLHLMVQFHWNNSIQSRKFSNASILVEDFQRFVKTLAKIFLLPIAKEPMAVVAIVDKQLKEIECSGMQSKIYQRTGSLFKEYELTELPPEMQIKTGAGHPIDQGKYQVYQLPLKEESTLYISDTEELPNDLLEMLKDTSKENAEVKNEKVGQFKNSNESLQNTDFNLLGINF